MSNRIAFLVGSGISRYAGMPTLQKITEDVLSGEGESPSPGVLEFLNRLKVEAQQYYSKKPGRTTNYEDLYFLASQIFHSEWSMIENPAVQAMIDKMHDDVEPLLSPALHGRTIPLKLEELATRTMEYIVGQIVRLLSNPLKFTSYLTPMVDCCNDPQVVQIDIFSLNHDVTMESLLQENHIAFCDGFVPELHTISESKVLRKYNRELFQITQSKVRLYKLHGSIDWLRYSPQGGNWHDEFIGNPRGDASFAFRDEGGQPLLPIESYEPRILVGTINKMLSYSDGIYADLHWELDRVLRETRTLAVSGYGFRDTGINWRLIDWVFSSANWRMTIIDPSPDRFRNAAASIDTMWDKWLREGNVVLIPRAIEATTWQEIRDSLR
jgi:hypothetical protein